MTEKVFGPIITGEEIDKERRRRSSKLDIKTVGASKWPLIYEKVAIEEKEGWSKHRRNKKSYQLSRPRPLDEQLEDEIWCIVAKMGFTELSSGRHFCIETKRDPNPRQIDVFAKDDEVALLIECTQSAKPVKSTSSNVNNLIEKISDFKGRIFSAVTDHYGREEKLKTKFIIATRNLEWGDADIEKCSNEDIAIITETEIDYYNGLTNHLKTAARYQFHAHIFGGTEIPGLSKEVPATRGAMGGVNFYNFLIEPEELLKISYVGHKASRSVDSLETYQRMLQPSRLRAIAEYISEGGIFPTNIVINIKTPRNRKLKYETSSPKGKAAYGTLTMPNFYGSAWVIDGQHRLYGYAYRNKDGVPKGDKSVLSVLAFENLPADKEMNMFIDINSKQVKVKTSLLIELYADLHWSSPNDEERLSALYARIISKLNSDKTSPLLDRVEVTGKEKTTYRCLTQTTLSDGLKYSRLLGSVRSGVYSPGPFADHDPKNMERSLTKAAGILLETFQLFAQAMPSHWDAGDKARVGYLCTNIGIRSILLMLMDICNHVNSKTSADLSTWSKSEIMDKITIYIQPVVDYFRGATSDQIQSFRRIGSSLALVKKQSMGMNLLIQEKIPEYKPNGLDEYVSSRDREGTSVAGEMINKIETQLHTHVVDGLKKKFGDQDDDWWIRGIPQNVRTKCVLEWENKNREEPVQAYLYLINYQDIAVANWDIWGDKFALGNPDTGNRRKCIEWIKQLNDIRGITHHRGGKSLATTEQVRFVEEIHAKVEQYFPSITGS